MILDQKKSMNIALIYLWIGFVCAISFMEAWLKFKAPGVTIEVGLAIGRLVFSALNKMEWIFAILILLNLLFSKKLLLFNNVAIILPVFILFIQTFWLLPILDARSEMYIRGDVLKPSNYHFYFVGMEIIKVISLVVFSFKLFK